MSLPPTELVKIEKTYTDLETVVKNQVLVDEKFEIADDFAEKSKCGEIFSKQNGNFILVCGYCGIEFDNMRLFGGHIREKHPDVIFQPQFQATPSAVIAIRTPIIEKLELNISADEFSEEQYSQYEEEEQCSRMSTSDSDDNNRKGVAISCNAYRSKKSLRRHQAKSGCRQNVSTNGNQQPKQATGMKEKIDEAEVKDPSLFCEICNRVFSSKYDFHCHANQLPLVLQNDPEFLKCKLCDKKFSNLSERTQHESTTHSEKPPNNCPHCPKIYALSEDLIEHLKRHMKRRDHWCEICGNAFVTKKVLTVHMSRHTGERPFACEDCGLTFPVQSQLNFHRKRHTEQRDYRCDVCQKAFYSSAMLKDHRIGHTNEQPFVCDVCGRRFSRVGAHKNHMKLHSDIKDYVCNICGKAYAQASSLYAHKKTHLK